MAATYRLRVKTVTVVSEETELSRRADAPESAAAVVSAWLDQLGSDRDREHVGFLALDGRHRVLGIKVTASGTATQAPVEPRQVWRAVLELGASAVILFHTHPSGDLEPSRDDLGLTRRMVDGGELLGVNVYDHIVLVPRGELGHGWLSLRHVRPRLFEPSPGAAMSAEVYR